MHPSILNKLTILAERLEELNHLLASDEVLNKPEKLRQYSQEHNQIAPIIQTFSQLKQNQQAQEDTKLLLNDPEMTALAKSELIELQQQNQQLTLELQKLMLPKDPFDEANIYLEIRAGTGGSEAAIFAGDLWKMYAKFAENNGWQLEVLSENPGEHGGFKEIISKITGQSVYAQLKFESGAHRVQRVPETESSGRIHTSAATVAILPEITEIDSITINPADLRIDTYRASGAGGQHVNKTDSAIRITHLPTGTVVECQEERSQHKNRAKAMNLLQSRLLHAQKQKQADEQAATRKSLVGSGDRSERIRTYNYPQGRLTDHRINLTLYNLTEILAGSLQQVISPLQQEQEAADLLNLQENQ